MNPDAQEYIPSKKIIVQPAQEESLTINKTEQIKQKICSQEELLIQQNNEFEIFLNEAVKALMHNAETTNKVQKTS